MVATERPELVPELVFDMFGVDRKAVVLAAREVQNFFGQENYDYFRTAGKKGDPIPEEARLRVDNEAYAKVGKMFNVAGGLEEWEKFWKMLMRQANDTVNYARGVLFADQERQATLTNNIAWDEGRPSSALERLTIPTKLIGEQCKYEQGRQLGLALLCAEVITRDENGQVRRILTQINTFLEDNLFIGRRGDPKKHHIFSYHEPHTNRLVGLSEQYPDPQFEEGLWVKSLDFPTRQLAVRDSKGEVTAVVPVLYDPREKEVESAVIKALQRSLLTDRTEPNGGIIETLPYGEDQLGFRLVVMEGGRPLRDQITSQLEALFWTFEGVYDIKPKDKVRVGKRRIDRVNMRRRLIFIDGLKGPVELQIHALKDWITQEYEVGEFSEELGMHDGPAHEFHKLEDVGEVAEYLWHPRVYCINLAEPKKSASYEYATRLGRKQRIYPSPYIGEN